MVSRIDIRCESVIEGLELTRTPGSAEPSSAAAVAAAAAAAVAAGKIKHPNQYTYRHKPASVTQPIAAVSPARRGAGTPAPPVPSLAPPQHDHGTRRAGAIAHGAIANPTLSASSVASLNWYIPDHLSSYVDTLPSTQPIALDIRSQRTLPSISRNHYHNQRYGPFTEQRDDQGKLILPEDPPLREPNGEAETHLEPPARVKYPAKRITVGEMRKRVRVILDYVYKIQSNDVKRAERMKELGIVVTSLPRKPKSKGKEKDEASGDDQGDTEQDVNADGTRQVTVAESETPMETDHEGDIAMNGDIPHPAGEKEIEPTAAPPVKKDEKEQTPEPPVRTSTELMEELVRDLLAFQDTFSANGLVTPMPPPVPTFDQALPIPIPEPIAVPDLDVEAGSNIPDSDIGTVPPTASTVAEPINTETSTEIAVEMGPEPTMESADLAPADTIDATDTTPASASAPAPAPISQPPPREIGTQLEMDTLLEQIPDEMSLDVYREGTVDQVVTGPEEKMVLDDPASASASASIPVPVPADVLESNPITSEEQETGVGLGMGIAQNPTASSGVGDAEQTLTGADNELDDLLKSSPDHAAAQVQGEAGAGAADEPRQLPSASATTPVNDNDPVPSSVPEPTTTTSTTNTTRVHSGIEHYTSNKLGELTESEFQALLDESNEGDRPLLRWLRQDAEVRAEAEAQRERDREKQRRRDLERGRGV